MREKRNRVLEVQLQHRAEGLYAFLIKVSFVHSSHEYNIKRTFQLRVQKYNQVNFITGKLEPVI